MAHGMCRRGERSPFGSVCQRCLMLRHGTRLRTPKVHRVMGYGCLRTVCNALESTEALLFEVFSLFDGM